MPMVHFVTLFSAVQSLLASLQSSELKEFCFSYGYKSELENLEQTVNIIKDLLLEAEFTIQPAVGLFDQHSGWIKELEDVVYDADDFFAEFVTLAKQHQHEQLIRDGNVPEKLQNHFNRFKSRAIADRMSKVAREIRKSFDALLGTNVQPDEARLNAKASLKWVFIVLNVVFEVCQAAFSQEAGQGKISRPIYLTLSIITSCLCLIMSLVEAYCEGRRSEVVWKKRGGCCWFYRPGEQGRLFGRFSLYFGIICSMVQLIINLIARFIRKDFLKFDYVPLLLSVGYMLAAVIESQRKTTSVTANCEHHGRRSPTSVCPGCKAEHYV